MNNVISNSLNFEVPKMDIHSMMPVKENEAGRQTPFLNILKDKISRQDGLQADRSELSMEQEVVLAAPGKKELKNMDNDEKNIKKPVSDDKSSEEQKKLISELGQKAGKTSSTLNAQKEHHSKKEISLHYLVSDSINLLGVLKKMDPDLFNRNVKEFNQILNNMQNLTRVKENKSQQLFQQLFSFWQKLKTALTENHGQFKISLLNNKNVFIRPEREENKSREKENFSISLLNHKKLDIKNFKITQLPGLKGMTAENKLNQESAFNKNPINVQMIDPLKTISKTAEKTEIKDVASLRKADINEIIQQIADKVRITVHNNQSEVVMSLKPEFLGKMFIKLDFKDNMLSGKFVVDNLYAEKMLKENMEVLKVNLQNSGMDIQQFDVSMSHDFNFQQFAQRPSTEHGTSYSHYFTDDSEVMENEVSLSETAMAYDELDWRSQNVNLTI